MSSAHACRLCGEELSRTFVDLGMSPLCESYIPAGQLDEPETFYPLHVRLCAACLLVQLPAYVSGEQIFSHYVLVLPWNLREEISAQLDYVRSWGGRLVFPIPALEIV